jgi:hypothetical protein
MTPRRPPAPAESGQRPGVPAGGRGRPVGPPSGKARAGRAPGSRPAASTRPRPGSAGRAEGTRGGTRAGSGRPLWVLGAVGVVLALLILPYFQKWLIQRSELESARAEVAQAQRDVTALQAQRARWLDDEYIKSQARSRLNYVMPGDIGYVVADPEPPAQKPTDPGTEAADIPTGDRPWFAQVWLSAQVAADPGAATGGTTGSGSR